MTQLSAPRSGRSPREGTWARVLKVFLGASLGLAAPGASNDLPPLPATPRKPVVDEYHGVRVVDDYRWLEDWNDPAVRDWSEAQNRHTRAYLDRLPKRQIIRTRLEALITGSSSRYYYVQVRQGLLFAMKMQPPMNQPYLVTLKSTDDVASERVIVNPNQIDPKGTTAIDFYVPSLDGRLVAVSLSQGGSEEGTVHVYDVATVKELGDVVPRVNGGTAGGSVAWNSDGSGFYYTRYPRGDERPKEDMDFYQQVYFHKLGTSTSEDTYSIGKDFPRIAEIQLGTSEDGHYLLATVANGDGGEFAHYLLRLASGTQPPAWRQITRFSDKVTQAAFGKDGSLYLLSRHGAPRGRIIRMPAGKPVLASAQTVVPESEAVIRNVVPAASRLYVVDLVGGPSRIRVFDYQGRQAGEVPILPSSAVWGVAAKDDEAIFENESFLVPEAWYHFDPSTNTVARTALFQKSPADFGDTEVVREFATSKDGTKVPMSVIRRKGIRLDGRNPALLTGYGGFGVSLQPYFDPTLRLWLDQGGVFVIANLRGGGEGGEEWHNAGKLTRKQNVFDDFIACATHLIDAGYTNPSRLAIEGGSNGGLLMGAALTQRPDLFRVVISFVGIYDMLRNEAMTANAVFNVTEYGTIKDREQFKALYSYSPYHHVVEGTPYPAIMFLTGANDPRVNPANSRKMAARLQAATSSKLPVLLRTSSSSGHGIGSALSEQIDEQADVYTFLFDQLGVRYKPSNP